MTYAASKQDSAPTFVSFKCTYVLERLGTGKTILIKVMSSSRKQTYIQERDEKQAFQGQLRGIILLDT